MQKNKYLNSPEILLTLSAVFLAYSLGNLIDQKLKTKSENNNGINCCLFKVVISILFVAIIVVSI